MRKILVLGFILFFLLSFLLIIKDSNTFAYIDCHNKKIELKEVTTLNLDEFIRKNNYELISFCSFDICYVKREDSILKSIDNFKIMINKYLSEDDYNELNIKGYPITSVVINDC